eukprot:1592580-Prymnesium_polylepis.1
MVRDEGRRAAPERAKRAETVGGLGVAMGQQDQNDAALFFCGRGRCVTELHVSRGPCPGCCCGERVGELARAGWCDSD